MAFHFSVEQETPLFDGISDNFSDSSVKSKAINNYVNNIMNPDTFSNENMLCLGWN
jgi:hypothetical protein